MKVLDLDMDFFLGGPCPMADMGKRPANDAQQVWPPEKVREFLEKRCGLSRSSRIPGAVFITHDAALDFWQARMREGRLTAPFSCVHVDTHSDLAFGPPGTDFVLRAVLGRAPEVRPSLAAYRTGKKLDEANYLLFALAFRWIDRLTYVRNPHSFEDVPLQLLDESGNIHLESDMSRLFEQKNGKEPTISFSRIDDWQLFRDGGFDYATLAQSPRYAPQSADYIMDIFRDYIDAPDSSSMVQEES